MSSESNMNLPIILLALWIVFESVRSVVGDEITVYPMYCEKTLVYGECAVDAFPFNRTTFRVYAASQEVISWSPGVNEVLVRLEHCAVRDTSNWKCRYPQSVVEVGFVDGEFVDSPEAEQIFYVGRIHWWWRKLVGS